MEEQNNTQFIYVQLR